ncbi:4003_t:CDS:2 [Paraglomus occultum]|uniref:4003_t:CDS:1 n=1 Tax=Paraglomus occultum TaxID=144539 RepID=A0A9N9D398_9GLOM|nr:4003_t:CDS:2 [Paraglomus occultum]
MDDGGELEGKRATLQSANYGKMMEAFVERSFLTEVGVEDLEREIEEIRTRKEIINEGTDDQTKKRLKSEKKIINEDNPKTNQLEKPRKKLTVPVLLQAIILLTANLLEKVAQFVQDRGEPVNIELLTWEQRKKILGIISTIYCRAYGIAKLRNKISERFLELCIPETWGIRGGINNLQKTSREDYVKKESGVIKLTYLVGGERKVLTLTKRIGIEEREIKEVGRVKEIITGKDVETGKAFVED